MDLEHAERDEAMNLPEAPPPSVAWSWEGWDDRGLPVDAGEPAPAADAAAALQELRAFHLYGRRPAGAGAVPDGAMPALLHGYRDLSRVRHDYPLCLDGADPATAIRTLTEWTDQFVAAHAEPGDAGEQLRNHVQRLESVVRSLASETAAERLSVLWDRATATVLETSRLAPEREKLLREHAAAARKAIGAATDVVACGPQAAGRLLQTGFNVFWRERCTGWLEDLDALIRGLENILVADESQSEAARSPEALRETLGTAGEDVDVSAMSKLLSRRPHESALPEERRNRIRAILDTLRRMRPVFDANAGKPRADAPVRADLVLEDCAAAVQEERRRATLMTGLFRAVRIARLEVQNRYRPELHDRFFDGFDERYLTTDERALCPPVLVRLSDEALSHAEIGVLLGILAGTTPVKVLVEIRSLYTLEGDDAAPGIRVSGIARVAGMAMALHHAYVLQAPLSRAGVLRARVLDGLRRPGPALYCVYAPVSSPEPAGASYLRAAAATASRAFPVLVYDPGKGDTLADRIDIADNEQPSGRWAVESFAYKRADGDETTREIAFTPADYFLADRRLAGHFWHLGAGQWHDSLTPVNEFLEMPASQAAGRIPYVLTVDGEGCVGRAVVSRPVIDAALQFRAFWRGKQESGGIENSFAKRLLEAEREKLAAEKERELEAIEKNYVAQLDQDVAELTREIVQRIAAQLMGAEGVSFVARAAAPAVPAPVAASAAAAPAAAPAAKAEEEEAVAFDDPYIDTPLCTSCNECTQLNNRLFAYNANKQAEIKDATAGPFSDLVRAAELCPVHIIHPGKPKNPNEPGLADWVARAAKFN